MNSVDSGVETGNDSNDSYATYDSPPVVETVTDNRRPITSAYMINPSKGNQCNNGLGMTTKTHPLHTPSSSSSNSKDEKSTLSKDKTEENEPTLHFRLPLSRSLLEFECEPPAGLTFRNLQPSSLTAATGYEVVPSGQCYTLAVYENGELHRKVRVIRSRFKKIPCVSLTNVWHMVKKPLYERKLSVAASMNNVDLVRTWLEQGVDPNCADSQGRTPLHLAASRGFSEVVRLLLEGGADPNKRDSLGNTPLHLAACTNHVAVVTLLLKAGTNVNCSDYYGRSPLQLAQSKLKVLQQGKHFENSQHVKREVQQVIEMMQEFLQKQGQDVEAELLNAFSSRLTLSNTKEQVDSDVRDLLDSLTNLSINKDDTPVN
uniref:Ankyrin repeat domain-containing protein 54 n=1 Tax=Timema californicum TaxID=61474 RepID=A0A7R9J1R1_TIMCA|nr:unnamed protein product [Timema californicum]